MTWWLLPIFWIFGSTTASGHQSSIFCVGVAKLSTGPPSSHDTKYISLWLHLCCWNVKHSPNIIISINSVKLNRFTELPWLVLNYIQSMAETLKVKSSLVNILQKSRSFARDRDSNFHFLPKKFLAFLNSNFHIFGQFVIKMLNSG